MFYTFSETIVYKLIFISDVKLNFISDIQRNNHYILLLRALCFAFRYDALHYKMLNKNTASDSYLLIIIVQMYLIHICVW